ncbi:LysR family transcriptional regulator [Pseudomonas fluorescens]|uniref:LysR family transcriptional regulator n=1 Tax=Pseudomonas fluorescens TaxID=294 RepID=A0A327N778_PSEFL|nr:LysR family transcriptional regulator [Pseudomonas fluorescens]RAI70862.1 LysR family transcriptional regulator [Pseudomonas fluorescens]
MDRFKAMEVFVAAAEAGSYAAASTKLFMTPQMVAKYVQALETRLGVRLLNRTTRRQSLTEFGQRYFERCKYILSVTEEAEFMAQDALEEPRGKIRISAPLNFGSGSFMSFLQSFLSSHPMVEVELTLSDQYVDLAHQGFEAAIRIGESSGSDSPDLVSRELRRYQLVPCASPDYIQKNGAPQAPQDLIRHTCLTYLFSDRTHQQEWIFSLNGTPVPARLNSRMRINDMRALINAAINGQGIVLAAEETLVDALRRGDLVRVLSDYEGPSRPLNLVYKADRQQTAVVKAFIKEAVEHFTSSLNLPF